MIGCRLDGPAPPGYRSAALTCALPSAPPRGSPSEVGGSHRCSLTLPVRPHFSSGCLIPTSGFPAFSWRPDTGGNGGGEDCGEEPREPSSRRSRGETEAVCATALRPRALVPGDPGARIAAQRPVQPPRSRVSPHRTVPGFVLFQK